MPRSRSDKYDSRKSNLLKVAAEMFADVGYVSCRMEDIAFKCDVSKSMLYHYFKRKEDLLYDILSDYVISINKNISDYLETARFDDPREYFITFLSQYLDLAAQSREKHAVTINDTRWLTAEQLREQEQLERENVDLMAQLLRKVNPDLEDGSYRVYAFLLIGMINWLGLWYKASGPMPRDELYGRIATLFLDGFMAGYPAGGVCVAELIADVRGGGANAFS